MKLITTDKFEEWLKTLPSRPEKQKVLARLSRISSGNLGDVKSVGGQLKEIRIFGHPAIRIYFSIVGKEILLLLHGGGKSKQSNDIKQAQVLLEEWQLEQKK